MISGNPGTGSVAAVQDRDGAGVWLGLVAVCLLAILLIPLPALVVDYCLALSLGVAVLILVTTLFIEKPTEFSVFPTILLLVTVLRLSINIATTRLVLTGGQDGDEAAGYIIAAFARIVMGGDFAVGVIIFCIIIVVNFIVIAKGSSRIAEVSARFSLDAMPGKQMAIDADLSAGLIDEAQATRRRLAIEEESAFFGAMDGASKFVRGDAIAGIAITVVNIVGGIVVGVFKYELSLAQAGEIYVKLAVGDGLVTQIPALIISLGAGFLVSKGATKVGAGRSIASQLLSGRPAVLVTAGTLGLFAIAPGFPFLPFLLIATGLLGSLYVIAPKVKEGPNIVMAQPDGAAQLLVRAAQEPNWSDRLAVRCGLQISSRLFANTVEFVGRSTRLRLKIGRQFGFDIPEISYGDDALLETDCYRVDLMGVPIARGRLKPGHVLVVVGDGPSPSMGGEETVEPAYGLRAVWLPEVLASRIRAEKFVPVECSSVLLTHIGEQIKANLAHLFSYKDMRRLLDQLEPEYKRLLDEITPSHISMSTLLLVLKGLLAERVSIRNLPVVLEAVSEVAPLSRRWESIVDHVRQRVAHQICSDASDNGTLKVLRLSATWELSFAQAIRRDQKGEIVTCSIEPSMIERFGASVSAAVRAQTEAGHEFVVATSSEVRPWVRLVLERLYPSIAVLAHGEISRLIQVEHIGVIE